MPLLTEWNQLVIIYHKKQFKTVQDIVHGQNFVDVAFSFREII